MLLMKLGPDLAQCEGSVGSLDTVQPIWPVSQCSTPMSAVSSPAL